MKERAFANVDSWERDRLGATLFHATRIAGRRPRFQAHARLRNPIDIGRRSPAFPVTPPYVRVRIRRFGGLS